MKKYLVLLLAILVLPSALAIDLDVEKLSSNEAVVIDINNPAVYNLNITNNGPTNTFEIYTYYGSGQEVTPEENFEIAQGETRNIRFKVFPPEGKLNTGSELLEYIIKPVDSKKEEDKFRDSLRIRKITLGDAFKVSASPITINSQYANVSLENQVNLDFEQVNAEFSSPFFGFERDFSLRPKEKKSFQENLNREEFDSTSAGFYTLEGEISAGNSEADIKGNIEFEEVSNIDSSSEKSGFLIVNEKVSKSNVGNVEKNVRVSVERDIISRMFTTLDPQPDLIDRDGSKVTYSWDGNLGPGESLDVEATTNWILPLIVVILLVAAIVLIKKYLETDVKIKKKTKFVKSKGDEFALRVDVFVEARRPVENVVIMERLPPLLKLYKKFGKEEPKKIDENAKKMEWEFDSLEPGEKRVLSYVAYSKVKVVGKFALPKTTGVYERDGKVKESASNRVYFVSEQNSKKSE